MHAGELHRNAINKSSAAQTTSKQARVDRVFSPGGANAFVSHQSFAQLDAVFAMKTK